MTYTNMHDVTTTVDEEVDITWLLTRVNQDTTVNFEITRDEHSCKTPRRNEQVRSLCEPVILGIPIPFIYPLFTFYTPPTSLYMYIHHIYMYRTHL